jgi:hypothetical protein
MKAILNIVTTSKNGNPRFGYTIQDATEEDKSALKQALGSYYAENEASKKPVFFTSLALGVEHGEEVSIYISKAGKVNIDNRKQVVASANRKQGF